MNIRELVKTCKAMIDGKPKTLRQRKKAFQLAAKRLNRSHEELTDEIAKRLSQHLAQAAKPQGEP